MNKYTCRFCGTELDTTFVDLGMSPLSNSYVSPEQVNHAEDFYPLEVFVCASCFLVQLPEHVAPEKIFSDYAYLSSYSTSWLQHAADYSARMIAEHSITAGSLVAEIASNDGYLLKNFKERGIPILGIEPAENVAEIAMESGINTIARFFGVQLAEELAGEGKRADLLIGNNVLAHVPDINDFVGGMKIFLNRGGFITMEFPHLLQLIDGNQFDTIYHEHYSYLSILAVQKIFAAHGLIIFDVEELRTHGGSLRIYAGHAEDEHAISERVHNLKQREIDSGLTSMETYKQFSRRVIDVKQQLLTMLISLKREGKQIVGYGAAAKGNTLLNYCGIRSDFLDYVVDRSPHKQDKLLPGTRIPILHPDRIESSRPDYVLILPWNLKDEIMTQLSFIREWGGQFITPIPTVEIHS